MVWTIYLTKLNLNIKNDYISELTACSQLSGGIFTAMFPKEIVPSDLFHYTKMSVLGKHRFLRAKFCAKN